MRSTKPRAGSRVVCTMTTMLAVDHRGHRPDAAGRPARRTGPPARGALQHVGVRVFLEGDQQVGAGAPSPRSGGGAGRARRRPPRRGRRSRARASAGRPRSRRSRRRPSRRAGPAAPCPPAARRAGRPAARRAASRRPRGWWCRRAARRRPGLRPPSSPVARRAGAPPTAGRRRSSCGRGAGRPGSSRARWNEASPVGRGAKVLVSVARVAVKTRMVVLCLGIREDGGATQTPLGDSSGQVSADSSARRACGDRAAPRRQRRAGLRPSPPRSGCRSRPAPPARRSRAPAVEAADQVAVGHEGAQAGPGAGRPADRQRRHRLDAVDAERDVQLLGLHVVRRDRVGVGRRAEQQAGVGLEVPGLVDADDQRPARDVTPGGGAKMKAERRFGCRPMRRTPASRAERVAPGAGRVDTHRRACRPAAGAAPASRRLALERRDLGVADDAGRRARRSPRRKPWCSACTSMSRGVGLVDARRAPLGPQHRHQRAAPASRPAARARR